MKERKWQIDDASRRLNREFQRRFLPEKSTLIRGSRVPSRLVAGADGVAAIQQANLAALDQVGNRRRRFAGIPAATRDREDQIAERKLGTMNFV